MHGQLLITPYAQNRNRRQGLRRGTFISQVLSTLIMYCCQLFGPQVRSKELVLLSDLYQSAAGVVLAGGTAAAGH